MDLTAVAAFTAAGLSFVNVLATARLASRSDLGRWRRAEIKPVVDRILVLTGETCKAWTSAATFRELQRLNPGLAADYQETVQEQWDRGKKAWDQLCSEVAQLDTIAAEPVRKAAETLRLRLESMGLHSRPVRGSLYPLRALEIDVYTPMMDLTTGARSEIGLDRETVQQRVRRLVRWPTKPSDGSSAQS